MSFVSVSGISVIHASVYSLSGWLTATHRHTHTHTHTLVNKSNLVHNFSLNVNFFSLHVLGDYVSIIRRRNNCIYATTGICHSVDDCLVCRVESTVHTRQSSTQSDKYQLSHTYIYFFWWWTHGRPKHVEKRNEHTKKNCALSWIYLQDCTRMHGEQNIKNTQTCYHDEFKWLSLPFVRKGYANKNVIIINWILKVTSDQMDYLQCLCRVGAGPSGRAV